MLDRLAGRLRPPRAVGSRAPALEPAAECLQIPREKGIGSHDDALREDDPRRRAGAKHSIPAQKVGA